jgi:Fe-S cluster biogenesis protein NfuA
MVDVHDAINTLLEKVRPYVQMHGGDVQLLRVEDGTAYLKVYGACVGCGLADATYNRTIGPLLIKEVEEIERVEFE